ncbi:thiamine-phosphate kinase [Ferroacidibacillus organovorans]|uniref:thiamine-phosphate kinase n=1 Tax=Ferroacidibacillus organovorans TaxID=1765683 RepID=UPI0015C4DD36|nr:thiamine-phosphate kinase [Ferroacidibacillus organovorans]
MRLHEIGEFGLIARLKEIVWRTDARVMVGIGDDAAVVTYERPVVMTTDALVQGIHFTRDTMTPETTGAKAVVATLSDLAAMGAVARHLLVTLALPPDTDVEEILAMYRGMADVCETYDVTLIGGDVVSTGGPLVISVTATGELLDKPLLRSGAKPGDILFVTGDLGGSAGFLHALFADRLTMLMPLDLALLRERHQRPTPQFAAAQILAEEGCTSLNDVSDGLASEAHEIAEASGVHLVIEADRIPIPPALRAYARMGRESPLDFALYGGEDYQLVGTVDVRRAGRVLARMQASGVRFTIIGRVTDGAPGVELLSQGIYQTIEKRGYNHFEAALRGDKEIR